MGTEFRAGFAAIALLLVSAAVATSPFAAAGADLPSGGSELANPLSGGISAQEPKAEVTDPIYNFGSTLSGPPLTHVFVIRNAGNAPLQIKSVATSCGCTAAKPSKSELAPGEISKITAQVDTRFEQGHSLSVVTVTTNDPHKPTVALKLEGVIKPQVTAQPAALDFGQVRHGIAASREVTVSDVVGGPRFAIKSIDNTSPYIKVMELPRADGHPGSLLHVALSAAMPPGPIHDTLRVETNRAPLRIAVLGVVTGDLTVVPAQVSFGVLPHRQGAVRILRLTNQGNRAISVLGVDSTNHSVTAQVAPVTSGKEYKVTVALRPNTPDGQVRGALTIRTNDPEQATVTVPFYGIVGSFEG
jgi:Protein of unknown function (DUF1573)/Flagellar-associated PapD-like